MLEKEAAIGFFLHMLVSLFMSAAMWFISSNTGFHQLDIFVLVFLLVALVSFGLMARALYRFQTYRDIVRKLKPKVVEHPLTHTIASDFRGFARSKGNKS